MRRMALVVMVMAGIAAAGTPPATAASGSVDRIHGIQTLLAVRMDADFPLRSLMRAECTDVQFVRLPD